MGQRTILLLFGMTLAAAEPALAAATASGVSLQDAPYQDLEHHVKKALDDWNVPGVAVAIIEKDALVLAKGYGVRKTGEKAAVDEKTVFAIGSVTKAFTAAAIGMLVDEGKLRWDTPIVQCLPGFVMSDPDIARVITLRDLLSHRTGLLRADWLWLHRPVDRDVLLRELRCLRFKQGPGTGFHYNNLLYLAAGEVIPATSGVNWDEFMKGRIFAPLGMIDSSTSIAALKGLENTATPHVKRGDTVRTVSWLPLDQIAPAGSINSNVVDMAQWVRMQLGEGKLNGTRILSAASIRDMRSAQVPVDREEVLAMFSGKCSYGFGWMIWDDAGRTIVEHGGNVEGMTAQVALVPEQKFGLVILCNMGQSELPRSLMGTILDLHFGRAPRDWSAERRASLKALSEAAGSNLKKIEGRRIPGSRPSLSLDKYEGFYREASKTVVVVVRRREGGLSLEIDRTSLGPIDHWSDDTFRIQTPAGPIYATFSKDAEGKVVKMTLAADDSPWMKSEDPIIPAAEFLGPYPD